MGRTKEVAIALSLANLCFLREWAVILKPSNWFYINVVLISMHLIALILNVLLLATAFYLGLVVARKSGRTWAMNFARWAFLGVLIVLLNAARELAGLNFGEFLFDRQGYWRFLLNYDWYFVVARFALCSCIAFGLLQWKNPVIRLAGLLAFIVIIVSPFALVTSSESVLFSALALLVMLQWQNQVVRLGARTMLIHLIKNKPQNPNLRIFFPVHLLYNRLITNKGLSLRQSPHRLGKGHQHKRRQDQNSSCPKANNLVLPLKHYEQGQGTEQNRLG